MLFLSLLGARAEFREEGRSAERVCVVEVAFERAELSEALYRIEGELRAAGFGLERFSVPNAESLSPEERETRCAAGTIELAWSSDGSVLEVRAFDGTASPPLSQSLPQGSPEFSPDWVSVRAVEVFRAALVQRQRGRPEGRSNSTVVRRFTREADEAEPRAAPPSAPEERVPGPRVDPAVDEGPGWLLFGGPLLRFDGGQPALALGVGGSRRFGFVLLGVSAEARLLAGRLEQDARVVEISQYSIAGDVGARLLRTERWFAFVAGHLGARRLEMVAHEDGETLAILAHHTSAFVGVSGFLGMRWSEAFGAGLSVGVESLLDQPRISLGAAEFGWGVPSFFVAPKLVVAF